MASTEPPPAQGERRGFVGFMTSLPGVLTALAALITAITGGIGLYLTRDDPPPPGGGDVYNITMEGVPAPREQAQVDVGALDPTLPAVSGNDEAAALVDGCIAGDPSSCDQLFLALAGECFDGWGGSCDALYFYSAAGSDYEVYGASCGGRFPDLAYVGACSTL